MFKTSSAAPVLCDILSVENQGTYKLMSGRVILQWHGAPTPIYFSPRSHFVFTLCYKVSFSYRDACIIAYKLVLWRSNVSHNAVCFVMRILGWGWNINEADDDVDSFSLCVKGLTQRKMKIDSPSYNFIPCEFIRSIKCKRRYFAECPSCSFPYNWNRWWFLLFSY